MVHLFENLEVNHIDAESRAHGYSIKHKVVQFPLVNRRSSSGTLRRRWTGQDRLALSFLFILSVLRQTSRRLFHLLFFLCVCIFLHIIIIIIVRTAINKSIFIY